MIEHEPWVGSRYKGEVMIWGFSHHKEKWENDHPDFTIDNIKNLGFNDSYTYHKKLKKIFGYTDPEKFWNDFAFANTLPNTVLDFYDHGSKEARDNAHIRITRILMDLKPRKAIVFTRKGWDLWPRFTIGHPTKPFQLIDKPILVTWGAYKTRPQSSTIAYCLPHPERQSNESMKSAVAAVLAHNPQM